MPRVSLVLAVQQDVPGDVGEVQACWLVDAALAVGQSEQRGDQALLLVAELDQLLAGCPQGVHGGFWVGDRDL